MKELNCNSASSAASKTQEPVNSSVEEVTLPVIMRTNRNVSVLISVCVCVFSRSSQESVEDTNVFDAISQVTELEEKVYVELRVELVPLYRE